jgi:hypothetical protein
VQAHGAKCAFLTFARLAVFSLGTILGQTPLETNPKPLLNALKPLKTNPKALLNALKFQDLGL